MAFGIPKINIEEIKKEFNAKFDALLAKLDEILKAIQEKP